MSLQALGENSSDQSSLEAKIHTSFTQSACEEALKVLARKFVKQPNGEVEELWEFDLDTYTIAVLATAKRGLVRSAFELVLALLTPVIQMLAFWNVLKHLTDQHGEWEEDGARSCNSTVQFICFLLIALEVSNEAMEGFHKLIFGFRALGGRYKDVCPAAGAVATVLGFAQFSISVATVGLCMLVVSAQQTALDAFLNFVAVTFLTEVDNILVAARTVTNYVSLESQITVRHAAGLDPEKDMPWPRSWLICVNFLCLCMMGLANHVVSIVARAPEFSGLKQLPSAIACALVLNALVYAGLRFHGGKLFFSAMALTCIAFVSVDLVWLYRHSYRIVPFLASQTVFWFALLPPACAAAAMHNPFPFLMCPVKGPLMVWCMLGCGVFCYDALKCFGA